MANITASVSNDADDADVMTTQCRRTWRYKLGYLATMLLLFGCEFDSQNPGIIVSPTAGIVTTESGATAQFTIALNSKPDAMVTIPIRSSNTNEGVVDPALVSFSASDWSTPKTVSVIGVDDSLQDGDTAYSINFEPTQSGDQRYQNLTITAISAVNRDNDNTAGITITPNSGLLTAEDLTADTFTLVLNKQPANTVNITVTSSDTSEGTVSPGNILFTTGNWNSPQTVTVTGVDDTIVDGDVNYNVGFDVQSTDSDYNTMVLTPVTAVNQDDDLPNPPKPSGGVTLTPAAGLNTSENLTNDIITVALNSQPADTVTIALTSSDISEATVSPASLTFTTDNWSTAQTVTVSGVDDTLADGDIGYSIVFAVQSSDANYNGLALTPVTAVNQDNDSADVTVTPNMLLTTSEAQSSVTFSVVLNSQPQSNVTISAASSDTTEGVVSPLSVTFTPDNWDTVVQFNVTGVDDTQVDGTIAYSVALTAQSSDLNYNGRSIPAVQLQNTDNDAPASQTPDVTLNPDSGLVTTENQTSASFTVVLNSPPSSDVTINVISGNVEEGLATPGSLTFTPGNWNTPQTVTVTGVDDLGVDGDVTYTIDFDVQSADTDYNGMALTPVTAVNQDNDSADITIIAESGTNTSEDLTTDTFTVALTSQPTDTVTVTFTSGNMGEGTVFPGSALFTAVNWNSPQTITVSGVDDSIVDGNVTYNIEFTVQSADNNYNGMTPTPLTVVNQDNDIADITVTPSSDLITSEDLTTDTFTLALTSQPADTVTVAITSDDITEGTVSPSSILFTSNNWNLTQTITVAGVDDTLVDGDTSYQIHFNVQSTDNNYNGKALSPVSVVNQDNDIGPAPDITITPPSDLQTSEDLTTDSFAVVLTSQPADTVIITVSSSNTSEGTVSPASLNFTTTNWSTPQTVTVSGVDDFSVDDNVTYNISLTVQSTDSNYDGMVLTPVTVVNLDNDTADITLTPPSDLMTSEDLTTDTFTVSLTSQPASTVSITLSSTDTSEGAVTPGSLTFTTANWNSAQTVTVTGVDDAIVDGDTGYAIALTVQSSDGNYDAMPITPVSAVNQDNDVPPPTSYVLYIEPGVIDIAASATGNGATQLPAMGYSLSNTLPGQTPGPVIEAVVGQTTTVEVINDHLNPHRFEIEGLLTNTPELLPGETQQFQFTPTEAGVYRYGDPQLLRRALGLQGAVVVRPAGNPNTAWSGGPAFDQERTWVIADFDETWLRNPAGVNIAQYNPNYFLMNGKSGFAAMQDPASTIEGNVGETFLIRIVNAGQYDQSLHFHSNHFQIISEGGFNYTNLTAAPMAATINVKRASTAMVLLTLTQTGTFPVLVHTAHMETGNGVYLNGTATYIIGR